MGIKKIWRMISAVWPDHYKNLKIAILKNIQLLILCTIISTATRMFGQKMDTVYVKSYPQKIRLLGYVSTSFIQVTDGDHTYTPNYPLNAGAGFAIKNTIFAAEAGYGIIPLKDSKTYGRSRMLDFQLHNYDRKMILDLFLQNYKGFYSEKKIGTVEGVFKDMSVTQIGIEATRVFNGEKFSSKAAFDLNEIQILSTGSWLGGGGAYYYKVKGAVNDEGGSLIKDLENLQLGVNAGYVYSWVINDRWMISAMAKGGANFGNAPAEVKKGKIEIYPTAYARFAGSYHKKNWGISMSVMLNNKSVYPINDNNLSLTNVSMQLSYVRHLDHLFKRDL